MSTISAKALFHFTSKKETLLKIIETGFRPSYCREFGEVTGGYLQELHIPMVCFCDLPLSNIEDHMTGSTWLNNNNIRTASGYGKYGLGMTKEWGILNGLNPVMYVTKDSHYLNNILTVQRQILPMQIFFNRQMIAIYDKYRDTNGKVDHSKIRPDEQERIGIEFKLAFAIEHLEECFSFYKPYIDERDSSIFYNEREWRYVVPGGDKSDYKVPVIFAQQYPEMLNDLKVYQQAINEKYMLIFKPEDVKYIIIDSDSDIDDVINKMRALPNEQYNETQINKLATRIVTYEQIKDDF